MNLAWKREHIMKLFIGIVVSLLVGAGCRLFDIPAPSPSAIPGAILVIATTLGYSSANRFLERRGHLSKNIHNCGGPSGTSLNAHHEAKDFAAGSEDKRI